jgi:hypothetical protein
VQSIRVDAVQLGGSLGGSEERLLDDGAFLDQRVVQVEENRAGVAHRPPKKPESIDVLPCTKPTFFDS